MTTSRILLCLALLATPLHATHHAGHVEDIRWHAGDLHSAMAEAKRSDQDVLAYFWSEASAACGDFYRNQMQSPRVSEAMQPFVCASIQLEAAGARAVFERYGIQTLPTLLLLDPSDKRALDGIMGSTNVPTVVRRLEHFARDEDTLRDFEARAAEAPDDLELRGELANRHASLGALDVAEELRASIRRDDPGGKTEVASMMFLSERSDQIVRSAHELTPKLVQALAAYVATIEPETTRRKGWDDVASLYNVLGDTESEMQAFRKGFPLVEDLQLYNWGWTNGLWWWSNRDALSKEDKAFALEVARKTVAVSERLSAEDPGYYDPGLFLTRRLNLLAMILHMNGKRKDAIELMERCVGIYPVSGEYQARLAAYKGKQPDMNFGGYIDYGASWSPNGRKLLFTSTRDGNPELYLTDLKRGKIERVTRQLGMDDHGAFCGKGKEVVFRSGRFKTEGIYRSKLNGTDCKLVLPLGDDPAAPVPSGAPSYQAGEETLALIRFDGGAPRVMVAGAGSDELRALFPDSEGEDSLGWAGKRLVYTSTRAGKRDLFIANADGSDERPLTNDDESWEVDASGSRDGKTVVFASWRDGKCNIYSIDSNGSSLKQLTDTDEQNRRPRLSPDGKRIAFDRTDANGTTRIWIMDANGKGAHPLFDGA